MNNPQISWYIAEPDGSLVPYEEYYLGSFQPQETLTIPISVWNNRWGTEDVENAVASKLAITFDTIEDASLLQYFYVKQGEGNFTPLIVQGVKGSVVLGTLSGLSNNGSLTAINNFRNVTLQIDHIPAHLKNSLRNMFIDLEYDSMEGGL